MLISHPKQIFPRFFWGGFSSGHQPPQSVQGVRGEGSGAFLNYLFHLHLDYWVYSKCAVVGKTQGGGVGPGSPPSGPPNPHEQ